MSDQTQTAERGALDDFVQMRNEAGTGQVPMVVNAPPADLVHGAQALDVYRDEERVLQRLRVLAAGMGEQWFYRFPVRNKKTGRTDYIEGPSVKLANDLCRVYGNCEVDCRAQDFGDTWLFHARFIDLETGYSLTRPFQARKSGGKIGGDDNDRRLDIAFQIGASKAIRNVVVNALQSFSDFAFDEARTSLVSKIVREGVEHWRQRTAERITNLVSLDRVEASIGRKAGEWLAPDIARIIAMGKAITDGMATVDETFPPLRGTQPDGKQQLDQFASTGVASEAPANPAPEDPGDSAGTDVPHSSVPVDDATANRNECIRKLMGIATDPGVSEQERMEVLDNLKPHWIEVTGDTAFVNQVVQIVIKVIKGELKAEPARKFLRQLRG